jgi:hypothetical protein
VVFGHQFVRASLERNLPPVTLLRGPVSVGKWTLGEYLLQHHKAKPYDTLKIEHLSIEAVRELHRFMSRAPFGEFKFALVRLDKAPEASMNALLKLLEEPPRWGKFILVSSGRPLDTITSRSQVHLLGLLEGEDMEKVLESLDVPKDSIPDLVALSRGQVAPLLAVGGVDKARALCMTVLKAIKDGDQELLDKAAQSWDATAHELLRRWCVEATTGRWGVFAGTETFGLVEGDPPTFPVKLLAALRVEARAKLALRACVGPLVEAKRVGG